MDFIRFTWKAFHEKKNEVEVRTVGRIAGDNLVIQEHILDKIKNITPGDVINLAEGSYLDEEGNPQVVIKNENPLTGWNEIHPRLVALLDEIEPKNRKIKICAIHVIVDPVYNDPDRDLKITIEAELNASRLIGTLFHRRICTIDP